MIDELDPPVRVEFARGPGVHQVALTGQEALERSVRAMNDAMGIIQSMADRVRHTVISMPARPSEIEIAFGIKFDAEAGAIIAKAGVEAAINVLFRWDVAERSVPSAESGADGDTSAGTPPGPRAPT